MHPALQARRKKVANSENYSTLPLNLYVGRLPSFASPPPFKSNGFPFVGEFYPMLLFRCDLAGNSTLIAWPHLHPLH